MSNIKVHFSGNITNKLEGESNSWMAFVSRAKALGVNDMGDISDAYTRYKAIFSDDEMVEEQTKLIDYNDPETLLMAKQEHEDNYVEEVEYVVVDESLVYSSDKADLPKVSNKFVDKDGMYDDTTQYTTAPVKKVHKKGKGRRRLPKRRTNTTNKPKVSAQEQVRREQQSRMTKAKAQASKTGVDPKILARVLKSQELKQRGKAFVKVVRS